MSGPRPRHPSDDARLKRRPHVSVDLTARSHRKIGPAFAEPAARGIVIGLWMLGREAWATNTGDIVTLTHADLAWVTGRERKVAALQELARVCRMVGYRVWIHPKGAPLPAWEELQSDLARSPCQPGTEPVRAWHGAGAEPVPAPCGAGASVARIPRDFGALSVHVRNLAKKQHVTSAKRGGTPHNSAPSGAGAGAGTGTGTGSTKNGGVAADHPAGSELPLGEQKAASPEPRINGEVTRVWPAIRRAFAIYGVHLRERPGEQYAAEIRARIRAGASEADLVNAVHGYAAMHDDVSAKRGDFDPARYFKPTTVFRKSKFDNYLQAYDSADGDPPFMRDWMGT